MECEISVFKCCDPPLQMSGAWCTSPWLFSEICKKICQHVSLITFKFYLSRAINTNDLKSRGLPKLFKSERYASLVVFFFSIKTFSKQNVSNKTCRYDLFMHQNLTGESAETEKGPVTFEKFEVKDKSHIVCP